MVSCWVKEHNLLKDAVQSAPPSEPVAESEAFRPPALYIHIPFCETKCPYCDFNTYAGIEHLIPAYVDALIQEINLWGRSLGQTRGGSTPPPTVHTIFFGGGTPSYLPPDYTRQILDAVRSIFPLDPSAEITLESNPGDVTRDRLEAWKAAGVNRLSIGVQSLDDGLLALLGRRHSAEMACQAYRSARLAGFPNVNLDLMYGLPRQSLEQWRQTLSQTLSLRPEHLSLYCLTLEEGTPLDTWVRQGKVPQPDPDLAADMYLLAEEMGAKDGYHHYEISNWALPGGACRHNLVYWRNQPYLGVGPGAHSSMGGYRFANLRSPRRYIQLIHQWSQNKAETSTLASLQRLGVLESLEPIDRRLEMAETMMLGLRLGEGIADADFRKRFGTGLGETYGTIITDLAGLGLVTMEGGCLRLTPRGRLLANEVFARFFESPGS